MTAKHTPGPWKMAGPVIYSPGEHGGTICELSEVRASALVTHQAVRISSPDFEEAAANARLIASAPELLAYVRARVCSDPECTAERCTEARRLIAKATGEQP